MPAVASALATAGVGVRQLTRVVCGSGPGGFTGLRIAAALAKGIVSGGDARLAAVPSLLLIVAGVLDRLEPGAYLATLDALRGECYAALVHVEPGPAEPASPARRGLAGSVSGRQRIAAHGVARRLSAAAAHAWADETGARVIGPGCVIDAWPQSRGVVHIEEAVADVDLGTWEPDYGRLAEAEVKRAAARGTVG